MTEKRDYTVPQVAELFSCSPGTVKKAINEGKVSAYRLRGVPNGHLRIPWAEVERLKVEWKYSPSTH